MKRKMSSFCPIGILLLLTLQAAHAQLSCHSGKPDPRILPILHFMPDNTLEQERAIPIAERVKAGPPFFQQVPAEKRPEIRITADSIRVVIYRPDKITSGTLPVIINYHGGGFVAPLLPWMYHIGYDMANQFNAIVFDVDYRVAPQFLFPVPVMDCYQAYHWILHHAADWGGDSSRLSITGGSSGANLAAVVCQLAKADGSAHKIKAVFLFCPPVDHPYHSPYPSYTENAKGYGLTANSALFLMENYTGNNLNDSSDIRLCPIRATDFSGLPPTLIITAEFDILRDEGEAYYHKLKSGGTPASYRCFPGQLHTFMGLPDDAEEWKEMNREIKVFFNKYLQSRVANKSEQCGE